MYHDINRKIFQDFLSISGPFMHLHRSFGEYFDKSPEVEGVFPPLRISTMIWLEQTVAVNGKCTVPDDSQESLLIAKTHFLQVLTNALQFNLDSPPDSILAILRRIPNWRENK